MGYTMYGQGMKAWVASNHFPARACGWVFGSDGGDVLADVCQHGVLAVLGVSIKYFEGQLFCDEPQVMFRSCSSDVMFNYSFNYS